MNIDNEIYEFRSYRDKIDALAIYGLKSVTSYGTVFCHPVFSIKGVYVSSLISEFNVKDLLVYSKGRWKYKDKKIKADVMKTRSFHLKLTKLKAKTDKLEKELYERYNIPTQPSRTLKDVIESVKKTVPNKGIGGIYG